MKIPLFEVDHLVPLFELHAIRRLDRDFTLADLGPVGGEDRATALLKRLVHRAPENQQIRVKFANLYVD